MDNLENEIVWGEGKMRTHCGVHKVCPTMSTDVEENHSGFCPFRLVLVEYGTFFRVCRGCVTYLSIEMVWTCER